MEYSNVSKERQIVDLECGPDQPSFYIYCTVDLYNVYCKTHSKISGIYLFQSHKKKSCQLKRLALAQNTSPNAKPWAKAYQLQHIHKLLEH